ncbi:hypothetical protein [Haliangium ochraceum]|uniref:Putative lipoprotein n=1 Tax=Haliangium ochraceum (strain DSM 14365 / JCM 11303 / SMP-2) TaxID=502025 RepID=D0LLT3_HALO1|nr:hypothetical protein [Haliangium ochraceum]ACY15111.1 putative lipoprotein [Haliangium ochraceum DSM 14365]
MIERISHPIRVSFALALLSLATTACGGDDDGGPSTPDARSVDEGQVLVDADIAADATWTADKTYVLAAKIYVVEGAALTIEPGTQVIGDPGAALIVTRGSSINAEGTADAPIVFTSARPEGSRTTGDWAGLVLMGAATLNREATESNLEGLDEEDPRSAFGGDDDAGNCGTLRYVRVEFAGDELKVGEELNGLTIAGCGAGTTIDYVQVHRGKDDGIEFFGGTASMKHVVISGASDDSLDWDLGYRGNIQFLIVNQLDGIGDNAFESDNNGDALDAEPRSAPTIYNATLVGSPDSRGMRLREGTWGVMRNFIVMNFGVTAVDVNDAETAAGTGDGSLTIENSIFFNIGSDGESYFEDESGAADDDGNFDEAAFFSDAARNNLFGVDPELASPSDSAAPSFVPAGSSAAAGAGVAAQGAFFDATDYIGAIEPGGTDWTAGWTSFPAN